MRSAAERHNVIRVDERDDNDRINERVERHLELAAYYENQHAE